MKTARVESVIESRERSGSQYWQMFFIKMKMDNWETISICKKRQDAFKTWDIINYEESVNDKWKTIWKEVKENNYKRSNSDYGKGAMVWMAIKEAFDLVYKDKWLDEAKKLTKEILLFAQELLNEKEEKTDTTESPKEDNDLPF